jgi:hypothetical protein
VEIAGRQFHERKVVSLKEGRRIGTLRHHVRIVASMSNIGGSRPTDLGRAAIGYPEPAGGPHAGSGRARVTQGPIANPVIDSPFAEPGRHSKVVEGQVSGELELGPSGSKCESVATVAHQARGMAKS